SACPTWRSETADSPPWYRSLCATPPAAYRPEHRAQAPGQLPLAAPLYIRVPAHTGGPICCTGGALPRPDPSYYPYFFGGAPWAQGGVGGAEGGVWGGVGAGATDTVGGAAPLPSSNPPRATNCAASTV